MTSHVNHHFYAFALMLWVVATLVSGCVSQDRAKRAPTFESRSQAIVEITQALEQASRKYEVAQASGDAIAMAQAALERIEIAERWFHPDQVARFSENSIIMIDRARLVASKSENAHEKLLKLLADADIGPDSETETSGRLFGNTGNALNRKRATTLVVKEKSERVVQLRVSDDIGVIVYIEAPALHGVRLQLTDAVGVVHCSDASEHGDLLCRFRPSDAGLVAASITNPGPTEVSVLMITNHPLADGSGWTGTAAKVFLKER